MKFTKKYDWMYRKMVANLCTSNYERKTFTNWFEQLGKLVDSENKD